MAGGAGRVSDAEVVDIHLKGFGVAEISDPTFVVLTWRRLWVLPLWIVTRRSKGTKRRRVWTRQPVLSDLYG